MPAAPARGGGPQEIEMSNGYAVAIPRTWRYRLNRARINIRQRILEDGADRGLGGPPNNWQHHTFQGREGGLGATELSVMFLNDAFEVGVAQRFLDDPGSESHWIVMMRTENFRRIAFWVLWRWAWGEWFGLRRWLYYQWLRRHVARITRRVEQRKDAA